MKVNPNPKSNRNPNPSPKTVDSMTRTVTLL
jgi:hypothetical protein